MLLYMALAPEAKITYKEGGPAAAAAFVCDNGATTLFAWHGFADAATDGAEQAGADCVVVEPSTLDELVEGVEPLADGGGVREGLEDPLAEPPATGRGDGGVEKVQERAVRVAVVAANEV